MTSTPSFPTPGLCMPSPASVHSASAHPQGSSSFSDTTETLVNCSVSADEPSSREEEGRLDSQSSWSVLRQAFRPWNLVDLCSPADEASTLSAKSSVTDSGLHRRLNKAEEEFLVDSYGYDSHTNLASSTASYSLASFPQVVSHHTSHQLSPLQEGDEEDIFWRCLLVPPRPAEQSSGDSRTRRETRRNHHPVSQRRSAASRSTSVTSFPRHSTHESTSTDLLSFSSASSRSSRTPQTAHIHVASPSCCSSSVSSSLHSVSCSEKEKDRSTCQMSPSSSQGRVLSCVESFFSESSANLHMVNRRHFHPHPCPRRLSLQENSFCASQNSYAHPSPPSEEVSTQIPHSSCLKKLISQTSEAVASHPRALNTRTSVPDYTSLPKPPCLHPPSSGSSSDLFVIENEEVDEFLSSSPAGGVCRVMPASGPPSIGLLTHQQTRYAVNSSSDEEEGNRIRDGASLGLSSSLSKKRTASQEKQKTQEDKEEENVDRDGNIHSEEEHYPGERSLSFFLDLSERERKFSPYRRFFSSEEKRGSRSRSQYSFFPLYQACVGEEESLGDSVGGRVRGIDDFEVSIVGDPLFEERRPRAEDISGNIMKFRRHTTQRPSLVSTTNTATTAASC
ncbi:hypothetical protein CSUI_000749 [Cystoisospora suis]|uniref:Uncharacterized protein n=1 Tax=Cystoisospora suis TaxID=483139 RepID=A0A2C6LFR7_9APIC|nr:hypothetical protein CSUI_000749 [Cystoisospora suis]